jgi:hypothetical protein
MRQRLLGLAGGALLAASCALSPSATPTPVPTPYPVADGQTTILTIDVSGFVTPGDSLPWLLLYGDGTLLRNPRADRVESWVPLVREMSQTHLTPADVQTVIRAADAAGLLGPDAHYEAEITDADDTSYRLVVGGVEHHVSTYGPASAPGSSQEARGRLDGFYSQVMEHLDSLLGHQVTWTTYQPTALSVKVQEPWAWTAAGTEPAWPLSVDPISATTPGEKPLHGCIAVTGADVGTFTTAAAKSGQDSVWIAPSGPWEVEARPVLPGETACQ